MQQSKKNQRSNIQSTPISFRALTAITICSLSLTVSLASTAPQSPEEVIQAMNSLGLNSESLACINVVGDEPAIVLDRLETEFATYELLLSLQENIAINQKTVHNANATLREQADDTDAQNMLEQAQTQVNLLLNQAVDTKTDLINTILDGLADAQLISPVIFALGPFQQLPPAYRVAVNSADEAKLLVWALKMQSVAQTSDSGISSDAQHAIQLANSQFEVQAALIRIVTFEQPNQFAMTEWALTH